MIDLQNVYEISGKECNGLVCKYADSVMADYVYFVFFEEMDSVRVVW